MARRYGETFRGLVQALRSNPSYVETIRSAAKETPAAISGAREPWKRETLKQLQPQLDREHLAIILGCKPDDSVITGLMEKLADVYRCCPAVAAEEHLTRVRLNDSFKPLESHAADLMHAVPGIAYCDYFVSRDSQLREHCRIVIRRAGLNCEVTAHIREIGRGARQSSAASLA